MVAFLSFLLSFIYLIFGFLWSLFYFFCSFTRDVKLIQPQAYFIMHCWAHAIFKSLFLSFCWHLISTLVFCLFLFVWQFRLVKFGTVTFFSNWIFNHLWLSIGNKIDHVFKSNPSRSFQAQPNFVLYFLDKNRYFHFSFFFFR